MSTTPAGWYPDPETTGTLRYWDGQQWTDHRAPMEQPPGGAPTQVMAPGADPVASKSRFPSWLKWGGGVLAVLFVIGAIFGGGDDEENAATIAAEASPSASTKPSDEPSGEPSKAAEEPSEEPSAEPSEEAEPAEEKATPTPKPKPKPKPRMTFAQENAVATAEDYLSYTAFSRSGLIEQLQFEGYSGKDATFAVDHIKVNWKEQAARAAKDYLAYTSFSRSGLIEQLEFEGYTTEQAVYGANKAGL